MSLEMSLVARVAAFIFIFCLSSANNLILSPPVATTYLGGDVHFVCTKPDVTMQIAWDAPFISASYFHNSNINVSELVIGNAHVYFNNTSVFCVGRYPSQLSKLYYSNPGDISIQGILSEVDVNFHRLDACTIQIYWTPPFTLLDVPILGYNVNITNLDTGTMIRTFIDDTKYNISLGYDYRVSINGVNGAGEGNASVIIINSTELFNSTEISGIKSINISQIDVSRNLTRWKIDTVVENEHFCQNRVSYHVCDHKKLHDCYNTSDITQKELPSNETMLSTIMLLPENLHFEVSVINKVGRYLLLTSFGEDMSTFDVQSVNKEEFGNESICFKIRYVKGSIATGCRFMLSCESVEMLFDIDGFSDQMNEKVWCSPSLSFEGIKTCLLQFYDKVNETVQFDNGPAVQYNVTANFTTKTTSTPDNDKDSDIVITTLLITLIFTVSVLIVTPLIILTSKVFYKRLILLSHNSAVDNEQNFKPVDRTNEALHEEETII